MIWNPKVVGPGGTFHSNAVRSPHRSRRLTRTLVVLTATSLALTGMAAPALAKDGDDDRGHKDKAFEQVNLFTDVDTGAFGPGVKIDPNLKNPWGVAFSATSPLWTANQFSNTSTLYAGTNQATATRFPPANPLVVQASSPTGIVFNPTTSFVVTQNGITAPARFIFAETVFPTDPTAPPVTSITGWHNGTATVPASEGKVGAFYAGLTLVPAQYKSGPLLLAADSAPGGNIDVYDANFKRVMPKKGHAFVDPKIDLTKTPPYNVQYLKGRVYVAYAPPFGEPGDSAVSVFKPNGKFIKRLITGAPLNGPWGLAIAPKHWGDFGGDLLVGNVFDGTINAFSARNGHFKGTLKGSDGMPLVNLGLWGIKFGNGTIGTPNDLVFAAGVGTTPGPNGFEEVYEHGLVGLITPVSHDDDDD